MSRIIKDVTSYWSVHRLQRMGAFWIARQRTRISFPNQKFTRNGSRSFPLVSCWTRRVVYYRGKIVSGCVRKIMRRDKKNCNEIGKRGEMRAMRKAISANFFSPLSTRAGNTKRLSTLGIASNFKINFSVSQPTYVCLHTNLITNLRK